MEHLHPIFLRKAIMPRLRAFAASTALVLAACGSTDSDTNSGGRGPDSTTLSGLGGGGAGGRGGGDTHGQGGGESDAFPGPTLVFDPLPDPIPVNPSPPAVLSWVSDGAVCVGKEAQRDGAAFVAPGWGRSWPATTDTSTGYVLTALPRSAIAVTEYRLTLECQSEARADNTVAIRRETAIVRLAPSVTLPNSCLNYLATLPQEERDRYEAYLPENRGFERLEQTLKEYSGKTLGVDTGGVAGGVPGDLQNNQYRALSFSLTGMRPPQPGWPPSAAIATMEMKKETFTTPIVHSEMTYSVSPCPGDFRPRDLYSGDVFVSSGCRTGEMAWSFNARIRTPTNAAPGFCNIEADRTYYFNVSRQNTMLDPGPDPQNPVPVPPVTCELEWNQCGQSMSFKNI